LRCRVLTIAQPIILFAVFIILKIINRRWWVRLDPDIGKLKSTLKGIEWLKSADGPEKFGAQFGHELQPSEMMVDVEEERLITPCEPTRNDSGLSHSPPQVHLRPWH